MTMKVYSPSKKRVIEITLEQKEKPSRLLMIARSVVVGMKKKSVTDN